MVGPILSQLEQKDELIAELQSQTSKDAVTIAELRNQKNKDAVRMAEDAVRIKELEEEVKRLKMQKSSVNN